jgi:hypothetical protein
MPSGVVKRKHKVTVAQKNAVTKNAIAAFGRISKSVPAAIAKNELKKEASIVVAAKTTSIPAPTASRKRKAEDEEITPPKTSSDTILVTTSKGNLNPFKKFKTTPKPSTLQVANSPERPKKRTFRKPVESPTKGVQSSLEAFFLSSPTRLPTLLPTPEKAAINSPIFEPSPCPVKLFNTDLPAEVQELSDLYSAFLTVLFIRQAHSEPTDFQSLQYGIERAWKKRRVNLEDIRRVIGIASHGISVVGQVYLDAVLCPFQLSDYGSGKICVEIGDATAQSALLNISRLKEHFQKSLDALYSHHVASESQKPFQETVLLAPITVCESLAKTSALHIKGQNRLIDLKARAQAAQITNNVSRPAASPTEPAWKSLLSRGSSLKDRIAAKEAHLASLPAGPSSEVLARRAALERLERVIPVLELLSNSSASQETCLFSVSRVVQNMRDSGNPIGEEEGMKCVKLAAECVPGWVSVMEVGKCTSVVIRRKLRVGKEEWMARVHRMMMKET